MTNDEMTATRQTMTVRELRQALFNCEDQDAPVLIDGKIVFEAWWTGDGYFLTSMEAK